LGVAARLNPPEIRKRPFFETIETKHCPETVMSNRLLFLLSLALSLSSNALISQDHRARKHPQVDYRLEQAADDGEGALVVFWTNAPWRPADVARDLGLTEVRGLDDWIAGEADRDALRRLVSDARIRFARPPFRAVPASDGVPLTGAPAQHALGNQGGNTKVCVIDPEFGQFSNAIASGYIPANVITMAFGPTAFDTGGNHGTSCLKVVHEMAPQAQLYAALIYYDIDVQLAANWAISQGCQITSGSFLMTLGNYWGQAGDVVQAGVSSLNAAGVLPVFAAGNQAARHQDGTYADVNLDGYMDWGVHGDSLPVNMAGGWNYFALTWNAWPATAIDYDMEIIDGGGNVVLASTNVQSGTQPPYEDISWSQGALSGMRLRIKLMNLPPGAQHPQLNLHLFNSASFPANARKRAGSIGLPAAIPETLAVAALHVTDWPNGNSASYSSFGPCFEDPSLAKPEITAPSAVMDPYYGTFAGTSAACPHVAGGAALFLALEPGLSGIPGALKSFVLAHADASGLPTGNQPFEFGLGRLTLPPTLRNGYAGACTLAPPTPAPNEAFSINVIGGQPFAPVTLVVDPIASAPLPFGAAAIHVGSPLAFPILDGLGVFGGPAGLPTLDGAGAISIPIVRPAVPLGIFGIRVQAGWIVLGVPTVSTPAVLDA
jgi:subtilisin family serine protease